MNRVVLSNVAKGNQKERLAQAALEKLGYIVTRTRNTSRKIRGRWVSFNNDFFGLFDLIAVHQNAAKFPQARFIQTTHYGSHTARMSKIDESPWPKDAPWFLTEVWAWKKAFGFIIFRRKPDGWIRLEEPIEVPRALE